jgi:predicted metal-dependent hydrolase
VAISIIIPLGEEFFIRTVKNFSSQVKSPELQSNLHGFIGQEAMHSKETNRCNQALHEFGLPIYDLSNWFKKLLHKMEKVAPKKLRLAMTAAAEHYTAVLGLWYLSSEYDNFVEPPVRNLIQWHAAEEIEHKAVTFDLLKEVSPYNYFLRALGYFLGMGFVWYSFRKILRELLKSQGLTNAQIRAETRAARRKRFSLLNFKFPHLLSYLRPGFHPNDLNDGGLSRKILVHQATGM